MEQRRKPIQYIKRKVSKRSPINNFVVIAILLEQVRGDLQDGHLVVRILHQLPATHITCLATTVKKYFFLTHYLLSKV